MNAGERSSFLQGSTGSGIMDADARRVWLNGLTEQVIGCAFQVGGTLGNGFLERVYENA